MSRNYRVGIRDLSQAGERFLQQAIRRKELSYSSVDAVRDRWGKFAIYAKANGVGRLESITPSLVRDYGRQLASQVQAGELSVAYAHSLVSAVNTVMHLTPARWKSVSPTKDCLIAQRSHIRATPVQTDRRAIHTALHTLYEAGNDTGAAIVVLARELGLRSKEAALFDANRALAQAKKYGYVSIIDGTKGGRYRQVPIIRREQIEALESASRTQRDRRAVMPEDRNWAQYRNDLKAVRNILKDAGFVRLHDLRAAYAADRYQQLTGNAAPINDGVIIDKTLDRRAREQISNELGHGRVSVVASYIGGQS